MCEQQVIALHNASYETSDAVYEASDIWTDAEDEGLTAIGYCYYHGQDLERAIEDHLLMIGGATENNVKEAITIGNKVVRALQAVGFEIDSNGSAKKE